MTVDLTSAEFRQLLDMVYIGNWVLNSARGDDRITEYDRIESKIFGLCSGTPLSALVEKRLGISFPSRAFEDGGIHEAIAYYEDAVFFDILAEELARRDLGYPDSGMYNELNERMQKYLAEFDANGVENVTVDGIDCIRDWKKDRPAAVLFIVWGAFPRRTPPTA